MKLSLSCSSFLARSPLTVAALFQVFPLPIEGFETRVVADDEQVIQYMIELSELLEQVRT